jgi:acyl-coenzyme A synthetase/AMP-(fatty) acid ligase
VQDAAVMAVEYDPDTRSIACAYVPQPGTDISPLALKKKLANVLPSYMLPQRWMSLPQLPRNNNGKADRPLLKQQFLQQGAIRHPHGSDSNVREEQRQEPLSVLP